MVIIGVLQYLYIHYKSISVIRVTIMSWLRYFLNFYFFKLHEVTRRRQREDGEELTYRCVCLPLVSIFVSSDYILLFRRHFLFKTGTGTTPLFSTAAPGYTMASGSVYSPPTRPLPRNTLSRSAFKFKKSSKYCSWKCTALCAVGVSVLLAVLLSYFIGKNTV